MARRERPEIHAEQPLRQMGDGDLIGLVGEDDQEAFRELYVRHARAARSLAMRICRQPALAEDAVQDAFIALWRSSRLYDRGRGTVRSWVLAIVRNTAIDATRRRQGVVEETLDGISLDGLALHGIGPDGLAGAKASSAPEGWVRADLRSALAALPGEQSTVIELAFYGGYSSSEIAAMMLTSVGTVKGRMRLGLGKLRAQLAGRRAAL